MSHEHNPWTVLSSRQVYESRLIRLDEERLRHESGRLTHYEVIRFKVFGVGVLPIDDTGCTYLVGQYRYVSSAYTWELVRGAGDLSAPALDSAKRELVEETGLVAEHWLEVLRLMASPGLTDERAPCFVAWGLSRGPAAPDDTESIKVRRIPFAQAVSAALRGEITDAASVATILAVHARAAQGELPYELAAVLRPQLEDLAASSAQLAPG